MALIECPECGNKISDKADKCPHCGLPSSYFDGKKDDAVAAVDYSNIKNILISFDSDYNSLFASDHFITHREVEHLKEVYGDYCTALNNQMVFQYICNNSGKLHIDTDLMTRFLRRMQQIEESEIVRE